LVTHPPAPQGRRPRLPGAITIHHYHYRHHYHRRWAITVRRTATIIIIVITLLPCGGGRLDGNGLEDAAGARNARCHCGGRGAVTFVRASVAAPAPPIVVMLMVTPAACLAPIGHTLFFSCDADAPGINTSTMHTSPGDARVTPAQVA
jgi:hypothetical protein